MILIKFHILFFQINLALENIIVLDLLEKISTRNLGFESGISFKSLFLSTTYGQYNILLLLSI